MQLEWIIWTRDADSGVQQTMQDIHSDLPDNPIKVVLDYLGDGQDSRLGTPTQDYLHSWVVCMINSTNDIQYFGPR